MIQDTIKLKVDFYADGFKSGVIEVPRKEIERLDDSERRRAVVAYLAGALGMRFAKYYYPGSPMNSIEIITCKYVKNEN